MSERRIPEVIEEPRLGMNTMESPKKLPQFASEKLINAYPGVSVKPRKGCTEKMRFVDSLGQGGIDVIYTPANCHIVKDDKDFVFLWHRGTGTNGDEHGVEIWNVTDETRQALELGTFDGPVNVSFTKLYEGVYLTIEQAYTTNHTSEHRTGNKFFWYENSQWNVREMGIDIEPDISDVQATEDADKTLVTVNSNYVTAHDGSGFDVQDLITFRKPTGIENGSHYSYTFVFIRRTDEYSKLQSDADRVFVVWEKVPWHEGGGGTVTDVGPDERTQTGYVTLASNGALTGSGTAFSSALTVGDKIRIAGIPTFYEITAIESDTSATVTNTDGDEYTGEVFTLLPKIGDAISTEVYRPGECVGVENIEKRELIETADSDYAGAYLYFPDSEAAKAKGATHIRVFRTLKGSSEIVVQGLTHRFLIDIPLGAPSRIFRDYITDNTLAGVLYQVESTGYDAPPAGRFSFWANGRFWIGGNPNRQGYWYASSAPVNTQFPQKYTSLYDLEGDYVTCDPDNAEKDTGGFEFLGDVYFCKERSIYRLANGDLNSKPYPITHGIGVAFPYSIAFGADINGVPAVYFLSESGPAILTAGGRVRLLTEFRIASLWPVGKDGILKSSAGVVTDWYTRNKVAGAYWNDAYWVFYGDSEDTLSSLEASNVLGVHHARDEQSVGGFEFELGEPEDVYSITYVMDEAISGNSNPTKYLESSDTITLVDPVYNDSNTYFEGWYSEETFETEVTEIPEGSTGDIILYGKKITCTDGDDNDYTVVKIGNQLWTIENWRSTKYADGTAIPHNAGGWQYLETPAYRWYDDTGDVSGQPDYTHEKYGALYNGYVVDPANPKSIAPEGWRVPTSSDWDVLRNYLIANGYNWDGTTTENKAGKSLASDGGEWTASATEGNVGNDQSSNNSSGFTALPGGYHDQTLGTRLIGGYGYCWQSDDNVSQGGLWRLKYNSSEFDDSAASRRRGFSIRLVRDI